MVRIPLPDKYPTDMEEIAAARGGFVPSLYRVMAHSASVTMAWANLGATIRYNTKLAPDVRELAICNIASKTRADYEWYHHHPLALDAGVTRAELEAIEVGKEHEVLKGTRLESVHYTTAVVRSEVSDEAVDRIAGFVGWEGVVELTALACYYTGVALFVAALDIEIEENGEN